MKSTALAAALLLSTAGTAAAMDVQTFMTKADSLRARGPLAPFSPDYSLLTQELAQSNQALRAERLSAQAAGRPPAYCPDPQRPVGATEIFAAMQAVPPSQRAHRQVRDVLRELYARIRPCRA